MEEITLKDLYESIGNAIKEHGNKKILVADDDEGNGYHPIYFAVTPMENFKDALSFCNLHGVSEKDAMANYIVIG